MYCYFVQIYNQECHDKEIEKMRYEQKEQEMYFEVEMAKMMELEENKRLREQVMSFFQSQYQSNVNIEWNQFISYHGYINRS